MSSGPVFIHSLFRAGSTYLFHVFRRSPAGYYAYQEPLHEIALAARDEPDRLLFDHGDEKAIQLRHPPIAGGYYRELRDVWPVWRDCLTGAAVYDSYFAPPGADIGIDYWRALTGAAKGRPVFQECRTSARIAAIRQALGGYHVYLWRNPWDQWWSHKVAGYFDAANQLIVQAAEPSAPVRLLLDELALPSYGRGDVGGALAFYLGCPPISEHSYLIFYLLWCLALQHGREHADLTINVDRLGESPPYRDEMLAQLGRAGIGGLDFADCAIPTSPYSQREQAGFAALEGRVHGWLRRGGWTDDEIAQLSRLRDAYAPAVQRGAVRGADSVLVQQLERARDLACVRESALARSAGGASSDPEQRLAQAAEARARETAAQLDRAVERARHAAGRAESAERAASSAADEVRQLQARLADAASRLELQAAAAAERDRQAECAARSAADEVRQLQAKLADATGRLELQAADAAERDRQAGLLQSQWIESRRRAEELTDRLGEQYQQAMALQAERDALRASWSWRVTRPLRWGGAVALRGTDAGGRALAPVAHATLEALRGPVAAAMRMVLRDPQLSARINRRLLRHPALHGQLVDIARRAGLVAMPPTAAMEQAPAATAVPASPATGAPMRHPLTGDETDIDELMLRIDDELARWRGSRG